MKKIILLSFLFLFSCSKDFDENIFKKVENENYSYLIPKQWDFEEWKFSKIITTKISENEIFLIKVINKNETWASFEEFEKMHLNKSWLIKTEVLEVNSENFHRFFYKNSEVILIEKWDFLYKIEISFEENSENLEKIEDLIKSIKLK